MLQADFMSIIKPWLFLINLLSFFSMLSCVHKPVFSISLSSDKNLPFVEFPKPVNAWPYGFRGEIYVKMEVPFAISVIEVPYPLWYQVRLWAEKERNYKFHHLGAEGSHGHLGKAPQPPTKLRQKSVRSPESYRRPKDDYGNKIWEQPVSQISWGDAVIWCNALSEYVNWFLQEEQWLPVYLDVQGEVLRSAERANMGDLQQNSDANGFRLPSEQEWELASRWVDGKNWLKGNWAAGALEDYSSPQATNLVAWYAHNSGGASWPVASRRPTAIGLYDMSGNLAEWVEDIFQVSSTDINLSKSRGTSVWEVSSSPSLPFRTIKGGAYLSPARELQVAGRLPALPEQAHRSIGFRLAFRLTSRVNLLQD